MVNQDIPPAQTGTLETMDGHSLKEPFSFVSSVRESTLNPYMWQATGECLNEKVEDRAHEHQSRDSRNQFHT